MTQGFHMTRFEEFKARGLAAYQREAWTEARYNLLRASEHLFKLARQSEGQIRTQRIESAGQLKEMALRIDPSNPPRRRRRGGGEGNGREAADAGDGSERFQQVERPTVTFDDIAGLEDVKEAVRLKMLYPFTHTEHARRYGIRPGGGVLLFGPPGTGKTMIARAIAGEIEAAFFSVKPSEIMSKWVGDSEQNIAELFRTARAQPVSIIFLDEIEALVPARRDAKSSVMTRVVPQILSELEGFDSAGKNPLLFLGATNEPWALDPAILRPGRFDEKIYVGLPDLPARLQMLELFLRDRPMADDLNLVELGERLEGYSGADIRNLCDRAAAEAFQTAVEEGHDARIDKDLIERAQRQVRPSVSPTDVQRFLAYARS